MHLHITIEINKQIMNLIKSKHDELFPIGHNTPESRYYQKLQRETEQAERYLKIPPRK